VGFFGRLFRLFASTPQSSRWSALRGIRFYPGRKVSGCILVLKPHIGLRDHRSQPFDLAGAIGKNLLFWTKDLRLRSGPRGFQISLVFGSCDPAGFRCSTSLEKFRKDGNSTSPVPHWVFFWFWTFETNPLWSGTVSVETRVCRKRWMVQKGSRDGKSQETARFRKSMM
jgi:hypothetical protein